MKTPMLNSNPSIATPLLNVNNIKETGPENRESVEANGADPFESYMNEIQRISVT